MTTLDLFNEALVQATKTVICTNRGHMKNPTPCSEWNCRDVMNHMAYEIAWVPDLLSGKTVKEIGNKYDGDLLGEDYKAAWGSIADKAKSAATSVDMDKTIHLSYADKSADYYLSELASDLLIHSWDLAQGRNCSLVFSKQISDKLYAIVEPKKDMLAKSGLFAEPIEISDNARTQDKVLAILGRKEPNPA